MGGWPSIYASFARAATLAIAALVLAAACDAEPGRDGGLPGLDAGHAADAGVPDSGALDAGVRGPGEACGADSECAGGLCTDGVCCDRRCDAACEACAEIATGISDGTCAPAIDARVCRPARGDCDAEEVCDGSAAECPADARMEAGVVCRPAAGLCDAPEACDGISDACPADAVRPAGTECRAATGACDLAETCDGVSAMCDVDAGPLAVSVSFLDPLCFGDLNGTATATATGGAAPYTYAWSSGGTAAMTSGLGPGRHTATVTDANGCMAQREVFLFEPPELTVELAPMRGTCGAGDGSVSSTVGGGTPIYAYAWSTGATTADLTGVGPGTYTLTVTDVNGCTATATDTLASPCERRIFVSSASYTSAFGGLAAADAECDALARAAGLPGTFRAWLSAGAQSAAARLTGAAVPYVRVDGVRVAASWTDLRDGTLDAPIQVDELGALVSTAVTAWTNTTATGATSGGTSTACGSWASPSVGIAFVGSASAVDATWTESAAVSCPGRMRRLYCVEQ